MFKRDIKFHSKQLQFLLKQHKRFFLKSANAKAPLWGDALFLPKGKQKNLLLKLQSFHSIYSPFSLFLKVKDV